MPRVAPKGFSLAELLVALTLGAVTMSAAWALLDGARRSYAGHAARIEQVQELRVALAIMVAELRQLSPIDTATPDIVDLAPESITFRSTKSLRFLCEPPDSVAGRVTLARSPRFGEAVVPAGPGSALLFASGDSASPRGLWLRATVVRVSEFEACPGGNPGTGVWLEGPAPGALARVEAGAPFRATETVRIQSYRDAAGDYWLGVRTWNQLGFSDLQPFAGPVAATGLRLEYFDRAGRETAVPAAVARIRITLSAPALDPAKPALELASDIALQNGRR